MRSQGQRWRPNLLRECQRRLQRRSALSNHRGLWSALEIIALGSKQKTPAKRINSLTNISTESGKKKSWRLRRIQRWRHVSQLTLDYCKVADMRRHGRR